MFRKGSKKPRISPRWSFPLHGVDEIPSNKAGFLLGGVALKGGFGYPSLKAHDVYMMFKHIFLRRLNLDHSIRDRPSDILS